MNEKIELWEKEYMPRYPELLELQIQCYDELGLNWEEIARKMIFTKIDRFLPFNGRSMDQSP